MSIKKRLERLEGINKLGAAGVVLYDLREHVAIRTKSGRVTTLTISECKRDKQEALAAGCTIIIDDVPGGAA